MFAIGTFGYSASSILMLCIYTLQPPSLQYWKRHIATVSYYGNAVHTGGISHNHVMDPEKLKFIMVRHENSSARYKDQETDATSRVRRGYVQCASGLTSPVGGGCCSSLPYQDAGADMMHKMIEIAPL